MGSLLQGVEGATVSAQVSQLRGFELGGCEGTHGVVKRQSRFPHQPLARLWLRISSSSLRDKHAGLPQPLRVNGKGVGRHTFQGREEPQLKGQKGFRGLFSTGQLCFQVRLAGVFFLTSVESEGFPTKTQEEEGSSGSSSQKETRPKA